jgi:endoglucanase
MHRLAALIFFAFGLSQAATAVQFHGQLKVTGNKILNARNEPAVLSGMSLYWSQWKPAFYTAQTVSWLATDWHANVVRAALAVGVSSTTSPDYLDDLANNNGNNKARIKAVVDGAIASGVYVIIDWHSHVADQHQAEAVAFFTEMAQTYGSYPNVIYEIFNEPTNQSWPTVKNYSTAVISAIRSKDPDNLILVGSPSWDQDVDVATASPITGYSNIAYTFHFYAGTHTLGAEGAKVTTALNRGFAIFISEWGASNADGNGGPFTAKSDTWLNWAATNKLSWCNWSIANLSESSAALNAGTTGISNWSTSDLSESGNYVRNKLISMNPGQNGYSSVITPSSSSTVTPSSSSVVRPSSSSSIITPVSSNSRIQNIPSRIEAESFNTQTGIQIETTTDAGGGSNVGYIDNGDWVQYAINVPQTTTYTLQFRIATSSTGGTIQILFKGLQVGTLTVGSTGGWQSWNTLETSVPLTQGQGDLRLVFGGGTTGLFNLNYFDVLSPSPTRNDKKILSGNPIFGSGRTLLFASNHPWTLATVRRSNGSFVAEYPITGLSRFEIPPLSHGAYTIQLKGHTESISLQRKF